MDPVKTTFAHHSPVGSQFSTVRNRHFVTKRQLSFFAEEENHEKYTNCKLCSDAALHNVSVEMLRDEFQKINFSTKDGFYAETRKK